MAVPASSVLFLLLAVVQAASPALARASESAAGDAGQYSMVCTQAYALCTSAPCIPDPHDATRTLCTCEVRTGMSYGSTPDPGGDCALFAPSVDENGVGLLVSTYSFDQSPSEPMMTCSAAEAWSDCLNQPCAVSPLDPLAAICSCKLVEPGEGEDWLTLGGQCNAATCGKAFWSGAWVSDTVAAARFLADAMNLEFVPRNYCPASARELNEAFGVPGSG